VQSRLGPLLGAPAKGGFPAARAAQITVSGSIRYTASDGTTHPARFIVVQIRDTDGTRLSTAATDDSGHYSATVSSSHADGTPRHVFIRALAQSAFTQAFVVRAPGATIPYEMHSVAHLASGPTMKIRLKAGNIRDNQTAFAVADALTTGITYTMRINDGQLFPLLTVSYPDSRTGYAASTRTILLGSAYRFEWDAILHEYGHFAAKSMGIDSNPGGDHSFFANLGDTLGKGPGIRRAWSEGFATWFGLTAQVVEGVAALKIPLAGDLFYDDPFGSYHVDLASNDGIASLGEDNELSVARALMAFFLDPGFGLTDTQIISALRAAGANQLSAAVIALMGAANAAKFDDSEPVDAARVALANDFGCALTDQAVAPAITAPADGTHLTESGPLTYTWQANGAGDKNRLDQFTVQFWSGNWDTLLFESPPQATTSFTPTQVQLDQIYSAQDASGQLPMTVHVVVKGTGTHDPVTGPYKSCAITQPVDPFLAAYPAGDPAYAVVPQSTVCYLAGLSLDAFQIYLVGARLQPLTQYDFWLTDPATGVPPTQLVYPPPTSDANGHIAQDVYLPQIPAHDSWTLTGTPTFGPAVQTKLQTGSSWCFYLTGPGTGAWGGTGLKPGTTATFSWNGAQISQSPVVSGGEYGTTFGTPCTTPSFTARIDGVTLDHGPDSLSFGPYSCTVLRGGARASPVVWRGPAKAAVRS
jgi:hypothetical protein